LAGAPHLPYLRCRITPLTKSRTVYCACPAVQPWIRTFPRERVEAIDGREESCLQAPQQDLGLRGEPRNPATSTEPTLSAAEYATPSSRRNATSLSSRGLPSLTTPNRHEPHTGDQSITHISPGSYALVPRGFWSIISDFANM